MSIPTYSTRQRKVLIDKIVSLTETEHNEIYKMLFDDINSRSEEMGFTQNRNGIFLNFRVISDEVVMKIENFVNFCNSNRQDLDEYDKRIKECKLNKDISKVLLTQHSMLDEDDLNPDGNSPCHSAKSARNSNNLADVIARETMAHSTKNEWFEVLKECKDKDRVSHYVDTLENNFNKVYKKKTCNMKYANAKKKYGRRVVADKKLDTDLTSNLEAEP